jgi:hypothetical protein
MVIPDLLGQGSRAVELGAARAGHADVLRRKRVGGPRQDSATREAVGLGLVAATKKESFETHLSSVASPETSTLASG